MENKIGKLLEELKKIGLTAEIEDKKTLEIQSDGFTYSPLLQIQIQNHNLIYKTLYWLRLDNMGTVFDVLEQNKELIAKIIVDIE